MTTCIRCENELQDGRCDACPSFDQCDVCGKAMPKNAKRCNGCNTYKRLPFLPNLTSIMTILGGTTIVISAVYSAYTIVSAFSSHADFRFATANDKAIGIKVWNAGSKPAVLLGYRLKIDALPDDQQMTLELSSGDTNAANNVIAGNAAPVTIWLETIPDARRYTKPEVKALSGLPSTNKVTLYVDVEESSGRKHTLKDHFTEDRLETYLPANLREGP
jgi:hypothetical protein